MRAVAALMAAATLVLGACGYKGPLYLPPPKAEMQRVPTPPPEPSPDSIPQRRPVPSEAAPPPK